MEKKIIIDDVKANLDLCRNLILKNIETSGLIESFDGELCTVTPKEHYNNIVAWCKKHLHTPIWSDKKSCKLTSSTSYGFKHQCERDLKCYVANNWMKMAMIDAGLEVKKLTGTCYNGEYGRSNIMLSDIITNKINFIVRTPPKSTYIIFDSIEPISYELYYRTGGYDFSGQKINLF